MDANLLDVVVDGEGDVLLKTSAGWLQLNGNEKGRVHDLAGLGEGVLKRSKVLGNLENSLQKFCEALKEHYEN